MPANEKASRQGRAASPGTGLIWGLGLAPTSGKQAGFMKPALLANFACVATHALLAGFDTVNNSGKLPFQNCSRHTVFPTSSRTLIKLDCRIYPRQPQNRIGL